MGSSPKVVGAQPLPALRDGTPMSWRFVVPSDRPAFEAALLRLSPEARYQRFHTATTELPPAVWDRLFGSIDQDRHIAVIILLAGEPVAVGHVLRDPSRPRTADVAVTVADKHRGRGIGTVTLDPSPREGEVMSILQHVVERHRDRRDERKYVRQIERALGEAQLLDPRAAGELRANLSH